MLRLRKSPISRTIGILEKHFSSTVDYSHRDILEHQIGLIDWVRDDISNGADIHTVEQIIDSKGLPSEIAESLKRHLRRLDEKIGLEHIANIKNLQTLNLSSLMGIEHSKVSSLAYYDTATNTIHYSKLNHAIMTHEIGHALETNRRNPDRILVGQSIFNLNDPNLTRGYIEAMQAFKVENIHGFTDMSSQHMSQSSIKALCTVFGAHKIARWSYRNDMKSLVDSMSDIYENDSDAVSFLIAHQVCYNYLIKEATHEQYAESAESLKDLSVKLYILSELEKIGDGRYNRNYKLLVDRINYIKDLFYTEFTVLYDRKEGRAVAYSDKSNKNIPLAKDKRFYDEAASQLLSYYSSVSNVSLKKVEAYRRETDDDIIYTDFFGNTPEFSKTGMHTYDKAKGKLMAIRH